MTKRYVLVVLLTLLMVGRTTHSVVSAQSESGTSWLNRFLAPDKAAQPWTFWYWMYGAVSDEGIRLDLQAMKDAGIAGFYLMPIKDVSDGAQYHGTARQLSEEWWKRMDTAYRTAGELGLEMGIHYSDGFALGGGPWIKPEESMQRVVWSDTIVDGGKVSVALPQPACKESYYEDIAVFAVPLFEQTLAKPQVSHSFPVASSTPVDIVFSYDEPFTLRSVQIVTGGNNYQAHRWQVSASDDGISYRRVRNIEPARQGWQNTDAYATYSIPATTAKYFKFHWTPVGSDPGGEDMDAAKWKPNLKVANIILGNEPVIDGYEGKSGAVWRVSSEVSSLNKPLDAVDFSQCLSLSDRFSAETSVLTTTLPKGRWRILRMGHTSTGHTNATGGGGRGLECDKFSVAAVNKQFDHWFGAICRHFKDIRSASSQSPLTRLHVDSWECGSQNWSANFADEFRQRRGYDLLPWLPVYAGVPLESVEKSDRVLRDIRLTIAELINDVFFTQLRKLADQWGMKLSTECVAPTMVSDGLLHYQFADYPMGEFWLNSPTHDKPNDMLDAISGAHIYGKNIVQAEGFTEVRGVWDEHPGMLKTLLDRNFCMGINGIVFHVNTHNPWTDRRPGMTLDGIGTFFQRDNTWWREMPAFTSYIARCQALLQYGEPVIDLAVYTGDEVPRRALLPERLTTALPGLLGDSLLTREQARLRNESQPMEVSPVGVNHTRNMTKAEEWINPLNGYHYDSFNHDVLSKMRVDNGDIVTAGGMRYAALVVPPSHKLNPNNINTAHGLLDNLRRQGARIIDQPWQKGCLHSIGIPRDAHLPVGIDYVHRNGPDADIYFLSNQTERTISFVPQFRAKRQYAYLLDAVNGKVYKADDHITLLPAHSVFYVTTDNSVECEQYVPINSVGQAKKTIALSGKWQVTFPDLDEPQTIVSDSLFDWSRYSNDNHIKYYSGHAVYETTFKYKGQGQAFLRLGNVQNMATVFLNGICCGTSWLAPHCIDITKAVKKGKNQLSVVVVNTWANALLGNDNGTPPFSNIWTNGKYRRAEKTLLPAGLIGPVEIVFGL